MRNPGLTKGRSASITRWIFPLQSSRTKTYKILFRTAHNMAIIAIRESTPMRSVNIAELKNRLSRYLTFAKGGEEIIIRDRNLPVAKLVPFSGDEGSEDELLLLRPAKCGCPRPR